MKPQLNYHLIVWANDRRAAAEFFSDIADMGPPSEFGHFTQYTKVGWEIITRPYGFGPDERRTGG